MEIVGELREPPCIRLDGRVAGERQSGCEADRKGKRAPEQSPTFEEPREEHERRDECETQCHGDERDAEARLRREGREIPVHQVDERQL